MTNTDGVLNRPALIPMTEAITRTRTTAEWIAVPELRAVPCGLINNIDQAFHEPQAPARGSRIEQERYPGAQPPAGEAINRVATVANPLHLSAGSVSLRYAPPALGQHTEEVL